MKCKPYYRLVFCFTPIRSNCTACGVHHLKERSTATVSLDNISLYRNRVTVSKEADGESRTNISHILSYIFSL